MHDPLAGLERLALRGRGIGQQAQFERVGAVPAEPARIPPVIGLGSPLRAGAVPDDLDRGVALAQPVEGARHGVADLRRGDDRPDLVGDRLVSLGVGGALDRDLHPHRGALAHAEDVGVADRPLLHLHGQREEVARVVVVGFGQHRLQHVRGQPRRDRVDHPRLAHRGQPGPGDLAPQLRLAGRPAVGPEDHSAPPRQRRLRPEIRGRSWSAGGRMKSRAAGAARRGDGTRW